MFKVNRRALLGASGAILASGAVYPHIAAAQEVNDDTPPVPTTPMPSVETFARTPLIDSIALSPNGKRVALITQKGDEKILLYYDVAQPELRQLNFGKVKIRDLFWGDNDQAVVVSSTSASLKEFRGKRQEFFTASSLDLKTAKLRTFFSSEDGFYNIIIGDIQRIKVNGAYRVTASNYQIGGRYNLCLYSFGFDSADGQKILEATDVTRNFVILPDGQPLAYSELDEERKQWNLYFNVALGKKDGNFKRIYQQKGELMGHPELIGLGRDGNSVVVSLYADDSEQASFHEISADGTLSAPLDPEGKDDDHQPLFHPTTLRLAGFTRHGDNVSRAYFDPLMKKLEEALPQVLGADFRLKSESFAEDPRKMIAYSEGDGDAGSYHYVDFSTGQSIEIAKNYPDLPDEWVTQKQAISYKAADGLDIHGYLTLPAFAAHKGLPLIVLPHGGPQARDYIGFDWQAQVMASRGYAVLQPNFRGSDGYGDSFVRAGFGEWGKKMQTDLSDGIRYLAGKGLIDPKRVAIFGASYGGYAALAGATLDSGTYRCAVSIAGPSDLKAMIDFERDKSASANSLRMRYWKQFMGEPAQYDVISPARQAAKAYCPILLIHGTDDTIVPIDQSQRMERALKAAGKPVEFVTYKGQDHWETIASTRIEMMKTALSFLQLHNPA